MTASLLVTLGVPEANCDIACTTVPKSHVSQTPGYHFRRAQDTNGNGGSKDALAALRFRGLVDTDSASLAIVRCISKW
jgi:hypothetical protein